MALYRGDNTGAFGGIFLTIYLNSDAEDLVISKAVFKCGPVIKEFDNPEFPLNVNLTERETSLLSPENTCYLAVWDEEGRKRTCEGSLSVKADARRV